MPKVTINVLPQVDQTTDLTATAVAAACPEGPIFRRAASLVRADPEAQSIRLWQPEALRVEISRYCDFTENGRPVQPPRWLSRAMIENPPQVFPALEAISATPLYDPKTQKTTVKGYHRASGTLVLSSGHRQPPATTTKKDSLKALLEPYEEFPFAKPIDRSNLLAALLTVYCRHLIDGPIPAFAVSAPMAGTGKSLLVKLLAAQVTGGTVDALMPVSGEEEMRKRLMSIALKAPQLVFLDNLTEGLRSESLCSAITGGSITDRVLGSTNMVEASFRSVWFITGNHLAIEGDMRRRVLHINLDANTQEPHLRRFKRGEDALMTQTTQQAPTSAGHATNLIRLFFADGSPQHSLSSLGSFKAWDQLVRSMVLWLGLEDPCRPIEPDYEERLLSDWQTKLMGRPVPAAYIYGHLSQALPPHARSSVRSLGKWLATLQAKGLVEKGPRSAKGQLWHIAT